MNIVNKPKYRDNIEPQDMWKVDTQRLLQEVLSNNGTSILVRPLQILGRLLFDVGEIASRINDPELNKLMIRLTIYECADPASPNYDRELCERVMGM